MVGETPYQSKKPSSPNVAKAVGEIKEELRKVSWPPKEDLQFCTKIVIGATFAFGLGIYAVDLLIKALLFSIKSSMLWIFG